MELQFKNVTKEYGSVPAVDHITYSMKKGVYGLLGVNGAGKRAINLLEQVGLAEKRKRRMRTLSGGMLRRVGIAQAMLNDPQILVLDEPTAGLDPNERIRFRNLVSELAEDRLVLLSTNIVSDVEYVANEIILMKEASCII